MKWSNPILQDFRYSKYWIVIGGRWGMSPPILFCFSWHSHGASRADFGHNLTSASSAQGLSSDLKARSILAHFTR
jgi:hypothetical protein